jgi:hypothetical protein|tara:strand:- start:1007 stop:1447 length:441 start_codon:yes stop_codon:yes gene_type:complete
MMVSDRFLVSLGEFIVTELGLGITPRLRDWNGTKGAQELILDAEEPVEHDGLDGVYSVEAVVALRLRGRDTTEASRRATMGSIVALVQADAATWITATANPRGIGSEGLKVFDLRTDDGVWEIEEKWLVGKVTVSALIAGVDAVGG